MQIFWYLWVAREAVNEAAGTWIKCAAGPDKSWSDAPEHTHYPQISHWYQVSVEIMPPNFLPGAELTPVWCFGVMNRYRWVWERNPQLQGELCLSEHPGLLLLRVQAALHGRVPAGPWGELCGWVWAAGLWALACSSWGSLGWGAVLKPCPELNVNTAVHLKMGIFELGTILTWIWNYPHLNLELSTSASLSL